MFDEKAFMKETFRHRTKKVKVPQLKDYFPADAKPVWEVRGMLGEEVAHTNEATNKNETILAVLEAIGGDSKNEKVSAFKDLLGVSTAEVPGEIIRRKEMLVACSVSPVCSEELAIKLARVFPTIFYTLTTEITRLTGLGQEVGKLKPSGKNNREPKPV